MTPSPAARACERCNGLGVIFKQGGGCIHTGEFVDDEEMPCPECRPAARAEAHAVGECDCPGHVASKLDPKVCARCGVHIDDLRPDDPEQGSSLEKGWW